MPTGRDVDSDEAARIGLVSQVCAGDQLLGACYEITARITSLSRVGVELAKRLLWSSLDAASLEGHMLHECVAQLYVRNLTGNFEDMIMAQGRPRPSTWTRSEKDARRVGGCGT